MDSKLKEKIKKFLAQHRLCVIATIHVDRVAPESAVVGFVENDNLEIFIGTSNMSRKYKNIQKNPHVSLVIGWDSSIGTIQYEGVATEVPQDKAKEITSLQVQKNPDSERFITREDQRYFLITPKWIRFMDNADNSPQIYEHAF